MESDLVVKLFSELHCIQERMSRIESLLSRIVSALGKSPRTTLRKIVLTIQRLDKWAIEAFQEHSNILSWFTILHDRLLTKKQTSQ